MAIQVATQTIEVVPVTRNLAPAEIGQLVENAVAKTVAAQVEPLKEEIRQLRAELADNFIRLDEKTQEVKKHKKGFLARLFGD